MLKLNSFSNCYHIILAIPIVVCLGNSSVVAQNMNNDRIDNILHEAVDSVSGSSGFWQFSIEEIPMMLITDETHNRMRIICPIMDLEYVTDDQLRQAMTANFHTALDVRYAASDGLLWSAFIHPLKELSNDQLIDGIRQAQLAAKTFGSTYNSTDLSFPSSQPNQEEEKPNEKKI